MKRWSSMAALSVCLAVLVALLAAVQWRWLDEIEGVEHYRRDARISGGAARFQMIFNREVNDLARRMAAPVGPAASTGAGLAARLDGWRGSSRWPELVAAVYLAEAAPDGAAWALSRLDPEARTLVPLPWPAELQPLATRLAEPSEPRRGEAPASFLVDPSIPAIVAPAATGTGSSVLIVLDERFLAERMIPEIVELNFPPPSFFDLEVAVAETESGRVVYSNLDIEHSSQFGAADRVQGLVREGAERADIWTIPPLLRPGVSGPRPGVTLVPPSWQRQATAEDEEWFGDFWSWAAYSGHWRLFVRDGANPIVDQAAAVRTRRAIVASVLLALLATTLALATAVTRRAQRATREQMEQIARVSHELRTPLAVLASAGDNLADGVARDEGKMRQYGELIQKETRRLLELVENVLHLSRRRAGTPSMARQRIDLVELIEGSLAVAEPSLREAGCTVERALPPHPVEIAGEPRALRSAVLNLLSNAIKYGGPQRWIRLALEQGDGSEARIVVEDRGPGIPAREIPRIFDAYARGDRAIADQTEGSGLGLAVVRDVVEAHSGRISIDSPAAGGTAVTLHLPLAGRR